MCGGLAAHVQPDGDLGIRKPGGHQLQHLLLAVGQNAEAPRAGPGRHPGGTEFGGDPVGLQGRPELLEITEACCR